MIFKTQSPHPGQPEVNTDWKPPTDPVFQYLLQEALIGTLEVFFAAVPLLRVKRYSPQFRPENSSEGREVIAQITAEWRRGEFKKLWVYPKGDLFVSADDYFTLAAAEAGEPDFLPCWVLGRPRTDITKDIQGPIDQKALRKMFELD
jgi:hypothetical protein